MAFRCRSGRGASSPPSGGARPACGGVGGATWPADRARGRRDTAWPRTAAPAPARRHRRCQRRCLQTACRMPPRRPTSPAPVAPPPTNLTLDTDRLSPTGRGRGHASAGRPSRRRRPAGTGRGLTATDRPRPRRQIHRKSQAQERKHGRKRKKKKEKKEKSDGVHV